MTYSIHFWEYPIPCRDGLAETIFSDLQNFRAPQNPRFTKLASELTKQYPCLDTLADPEDGVWTDSPLDGRTELQVYGIGIRSDHLDKVLPFVIDTANSQRLCVYDTQSGQAYLPAGQQVTTVYVEPNQPRRATHAKTDVALAERIIADCISPILGGAGFQHIGYQFVRPIENGWQAVRYGIGAQQDGAEYLRIQFGINFRSVLDALDAIGKSSHINEIVTDWGAVLHEFSRNSNVFFPVRSMVELLDALKWVPDLLKERVVPSLNRCTSIQDFDRFLNEEHKNNNRLMANVRGDYRVLIHLLANPGNVNDFDLAYQTMVAQWTAEEATAIVKVIQYLKKQQQPLVGSEVQWGRPLSGD